jgi:hypothetical protein
VYNDNSISTIQESLQSIHLANNAKRGWTTESIEYYCVLCLFTKFSNKWFVSIEDSFPWNKNTKKSHSEY